MRHCGDDVRELLHDGHMRHVKLRPGTEIDQQALAALIQAAYSLVKSQAEHR